MRNPNIQNACLDLMMMLTNPCNKKLKKKKMEGVPDYLTQIKTSTGSAYTLNIYKIADDFVATSQNMSGLLRHFVEVLKKIFRFDYDPSDMWRQSPLVNNFTTNDRKQMSMSHHLTFNGSLVFVLSPMMERDATHMTTGMTQQQKDDPESGFFLFILFLFINLVCS